MRCLCHSCGGDEATTERTSAGGSGSYTALHDATPIVYTVLLANALFLDYCPASEHSLLHNRRTSCCWVTRCALQQVRAADSIYAYNSNNLRAPYRYSARACWFSLTSDSRPVATRALSVITRDSMFPTPSLACAVTQLQLKLIQAWHACHSFIARTPWLRSW